MPFVKTRVTFVLASLAALATLPARGQEEPAQGKADTEKVRRAAETIFRRIDALRQAAARLQLDGLDRDWTAFPQFSDPTLGNEGDAHRDIVAAAIAPTESDLWIMLRTAEGPSQDDWTYYVSVDMWGDLGSNFRIDVQSPQRPLTLRMLDTSGNVSKPVPLPRARMVIRRVVEMRIPYGDIAAAVPADKAQWVTGKQVRPWVRVEFHTFDARKQRPVDRGPSVASFRLVATPYPLEPPLPERPARPVVLPLPVTGLWYVSQGAFGSESHRDRWAYDLVRLDSKGTQSSPWHAKQNSQYLAWGQPVTSPVAGQVLRARSEIDDSPPHGQFDPKAKANEVFLLAAATPTFGVGLGHLQKGSLTVAKGDRVAAGQKIALVGNSGASDSPHLHVAVWQGRFLQTTAPLAFHKVRVGLNPVHNDPWARELPFWEPRQGYFVEALPADPLPASPTGVKLQ